MSLASRLKPLLLLGVGLTIGALTGEVALRIAAHASTRLHELLEDPLAVKIEPHGTYGYRQRAGAVFAYANGTSAIANPKGYRGPVVVVPKPPGSLRVVLLGGSTSHGWGVNDGQTIDAFLRTALAQRLPGRSIDVVNLGFDGYDSYQDLERLRTDGIPLDPDIVIANSGINDVRNAKIDDVHDPQSSALIWEDVLQRLRKEEAMGHPTLWTLTKHYFYLARTSSMVRTLLRVRPRETPTTAAPVDWHPTSAAADYFQANLTSIAALSAEHHIAVILSTPPSSLDSPMYPPEATLGRDYWLPTAGMTQVYRDTLDHRMQVLAKTLQEQGQDVMYVPHRLTADSSVFLDDAHLTPKGNRQMAEDFVPAILALAAHRDSLVGRR